MNWHKLLSEVIYGIYMLVGVVAILFASVYFRPEGALESISFCLITVLCIYISMLIVYWLMPAKIRVYWHNDPPK